MWRCKLQNHQIAVLDAQVPDYVPLATEVSKNVFWLVLDDRLAVAVTVAPAPTRNKDHTSCLGIIRFIANNK